jgi:hypothetical protein
MQYKTITIVEQVEVHGAVYEHSMKELQSLLDEGYKIINVSSSHERLPNVSSSHEEIQPTNLLLAITYLLVLE